jgi:hypothetical protein
LPAVHQRNRTDQQRHPALADDHKVAYHYIAPGKPTQNAFAESLGGCATSC